jgi:hypothetical protein
MGHENVMSTYSSRSLGNRLLEIRPDRTGKVTRINMIASQKILK